VDGDNGLDRLPFLVAVRVIVYLTILLLLQFQHLLRFLLRIVRILPDFFVLNFLDDLRERFGHVGRLALLVEECDVACLEVVGVELHERQEPLQVLADERAFG